MAITTTMRMSEHNHTKQTDVEFIASIADFCAHEGARFTDSRREVAAIIARSEKPIGAYDILDQLGQIMDNPKPPTVYRAIDFLLENHFIHKIESLNAFIACGSDHRHSGSQFMICNTCGKVIETHLCSLPSALKTSADKHGFKPQTWSVEVHGLCAECA